MRVTTYTAYENAIYNLQSRQKGMVQSQEQMTSGKRVHRASDDPVAAARAERSLDAVTRAEAHQRALEASRSSTQLAESALGDAGELIQQAREKLVAAGNASYSAAERQTLAKSLQQLREQLLSVANRADGTGTYIFGGQGADSPPLVENAAGVVEFRGASGDTRVASSEGLATQIDGRQAWLSAPNPYNSGALDLSIFDTLRTAITELNDTTRTDPQVHQTVQESLTRVDAFNNHLLAVRARSGEALNRMDTAELRIADNKLAAQTERSNAEDLDMVQALSEFQNRQTGYDAALKAYSLVQRMSLFNYING